MSIAVGIRYLCGWAMATHPADREQAEWPPHPDRVFMALAAAHFETDNDPFEQEALEWLESQPAPALVASPCLPRTPVTSYVPVNDAVMPKLRADKEPSADQVRSGLSLLPDFRSRQARGFPVAIPDDDTVFLEWPTEPPARLRDALAALCRKVTYVGHSASLVQMWIADEPRSPSPSGEKPSHRMLRPVSGRTRHRLRVTGPGRLSYLRSQFESGFRPASARSQGYDTELQEKPQPTEPHSIFDSALVILRKTAGPAGRDKEIFAGRDRKLALARQRALGLESALQVTEALRGAVMKFCPEPVPEWISGHRTDRSPSEQPHMAFMALPHVGHEHADGHLLGVALTVPKSIAPEERRRCLSDLLYEESGQPRQIKLVMGKIGEWTLTLEDRESRPLALVPEVWTAAVPAPPARRWGTVTPIVLDRHPKTANAAEYWSAVEATIRQACVRIGLPEPIDVIASPVSMFVGAPHGRSFPLMQRKTGGNLHHTHAIITFSEPVRGPILLGAGRYRGYGLCRPLVAEGSVQP